MVKLKNKFRCGLLFKIMTEKLSNLTSLELQFEGRQIYQTEQSINLLMKMGR